MNQIVKGRSVLNFRFVVNLLRNSGAKYYSVSKKCKTLCFYSVSLRFNGHFPGEPGLASVF